MWTPRKHFERDVRPPCEAYKADPTSEWKARAAAQALNNSVEWTFQYYQSNDQGKLQGAADLKTFKERLIHDCPDYRIVWDLADAAKHRFLTRKPEFRAITSSTGAWTESEDTLELVNTGEEVDVIIGSVFEYWDQRL